TSRHYVNLGRELEQNFAELLSGRDAVFLCPTHPEPAPKHRTPVFRGFNFAYAGIFNVLRLPVTACAVRLGEHSGLPVGIQVGMQGVIDCRLFWGTMFILSGTAFTLLQAAIK